MKPPKPTACALPRALDSNRIAFAPPAIADTGAQRGARLLAGALALVRQLDSDALPESAAKKASEWLLPELHHLGTRGLLTVLDAILPNLSEALALPSSSAPRAYSLIPTALSHLRTVEPHDNLKTADGTPLQDGEAIVAHVVAALQAANWSEASLVPLATMLRDLNLPNTARRSLVLRFAKRFGDVEPLALPALVYQVCVPRTPGQFERGSQPFLSPHLLPFASGAATTKRAPPIRPHSARQLLTLCHPPMCGAASSSCLPTPMVRRRFSTLCTGILTSPLQAPATRPPFRPWRTRASRG